jgi:competence protein ComEC
MPMMPVRSAIIGFALGAWLLQLQPALPRWPLMLLLCLLVIMVVAMPCRCRLAGIRIVIALAGGVIAGFVWAAAVAHYYLAQELPKEWEGRDITVVGTVASLPHHIERGVRFLFRIEQASVDGQAVELALSKVALSWYSGFRDDAESAAVDLHPGQRWRLNMRLQRPHGNANPHGFDYEVWLLQQRIRATGYVRTDKASASDNRRLDDFVFSIGHLIERSRDAIRSRIFTALPQQPYAGVIAALVVGDQRAIEQSDWQVFNRTGVGHLIAISGLHITMIAGLFASLMFHLWRRSFFTAAALPLRLPAQKAAALAGAASALVYVALAGFGVPAQRTLYMLMVVALALWLGRLASASHVLCVALGVVVLLDPWAVLAPGFWLSFSAVGIILYTSLGRAHAAAAMPTRGWVRALQDGARTQYAVTLGLVPLTMLLFAQVSLVGPIANAVAIPLISLLITPAALIGSFAPAPLSAVMLQGAHWLIAWLAQFLGWLSNLPLAVWGAPVPSALIFACALAGTVWMLAPRGWPLRWLGLSGWLPLLLNAPAQPGSNEMWVTAFDVGQGMALMVETRHHRLLYDTGPRHSNESNGATRVILPYLKARGITALDGMIISHGDSDHAGGALSMLDGVRIGWVASSLPADSDIVRAASEHRRCSRGQAWRWDGVHFDILHPDVVSYDSAKWKPNARSCVVKITLGQRSLLLAGDIEAMQEMQLLHGVPDKLRSTVLLAPHHGSGTSSTMPFLQAVRPEIALFQVGYRNRYRHPKAEIYQRYADLGIRRMRSDQSGAVTLYFGTGLTAAEYRVDQARYWHGR